MLSRPTINNGLRIALTFAASLIGAFSILAGPDVMINQTDPKDVTLDKVDAKSVNLDKEGPVVEVPTTRSSRGLITLEGPSGMFIDPTSATLPQGTFVLNYCVFVPTLPEGVSLVGHGILLSYGIRDWLEIGFIGDLLDLSVDQHTATVGQGEGRRTIIVGATENTYVIGGPEARIRLLRDRSDKWWPEVSIGTYFHLGTPSGPLGALNGYNAFVAASKTVPICEHGLVKTITFQGGFRTQWLTDDAVDESTSERGYGGLEVQLPCHFYAIGEIISRDNKL